MIPSNAGPFALGAVNVACYIGIGVIMMTFTNSPVAWGVSLGLFRPYSTAFIAYFWIQHDQSASPCSLFCVD